MSCAPVVITFEAESRDTGLVEREYAVALEMREVEVLTIAGQGPPGRQGIPGPAGGSALQRVAGEPLSALLVVYELNGLAYALDQADAAHIELLLGVTLTAADAGDPLNIQRSGVIEDSAWNWQLGRVWLGAGGTLTQTPPATGFLVLIGAATSATRITLNLQDPIELE
ncbi:capsid cement protein [Pseudomonas gingeri]|uniref:capsid cement protein n=1 Tax=Pseudomonas gingeri TaxID=117681 RepID=UPI0015BEA576|nr:capsid cement protein [Pseudomonas gingeri]NWD49010.1 hypothetical protein [Pseudomonas gingeri]